LHAGKHNEEAQLYAFECQPATAAISASCRCQPAGRQTLARGGWLLFHYRTAEPKRATA
jgi:hypothetical protein